MQRNNQQQPGAALLAVLLIVTLAGALLILGARSLLQGSRTSAYRGTSSSALAIARAGIEEGMLRFTDYNDHVTAGNTAATGSLYLGEMGEGAIANNGRSAYSLLPLRRGFTDAACTQLSDEHGLSSASSTYTPNCPFYDLAVRRSVAITLGGNDPTTSTYSYTAAELPAGNKLVTLNIKSFFAFSIRPTFVGGNGTLLAETYSNYEDLNPNNQVESYTITQLNGNSPAQSFLSAAKSIRLTVQSGTVDKVYVEQGAAASGTLVIDKGYTTIESTGHVGGIEKRLVLSIHPYTTPSIQMFETDKSFSATGWLLPTPGLP